MTRPEVGLKRGLASYKSATSSVDMWMRKQHPHANTDCSSTASTRRHDINSCRKRKISSDCPMHGQNSASTNQKKRQLKKPSSLDWHGWTRNSVRASVDWQPVGYETVAGEKRVSRQPSSSAPSTAPSTALSTAPNTAPSSTQTESGKSEPIQQSK